jgi:two-component system, OmpR family, response regulator
LSNRVLKTILYVEDDKDIQTIGKMTLETFGNLNVVICNTGKEALEKIKDAKPDLVLMDVMMPEMDGITAMLELQKDPEVSEIPVIFMTAKAQVHEVEKYNKMGVAGVIIKPFDPVQLYPQICEIWEKFYDKSTI